MKYQSELIKEIVEARGHEKSSLHYESECVKKWIEETEGAYPKLSDYQGEWLNYINENPLGEFPYETVTDVTDTTVNNVVPYAYKSAILKGNTGYRDIDTGEFLETFEEGRNLELVSVKMPVLTTSNEDGTKTNILTANEPIELRGIDEVKDELNLLTGELTERLITKTYDGSENWSIGHSNTDEKLIYFQMNDGDFKNGPSIVAINNLVGEYRNPYAAPIYNTITIVFSSIRIRLGSEINTLELFKDYLSKNNLIITAERSQKSIKTVDLTVIDQDGNTLSRIKPIEGTMHIHSDGTPLKPSITMEIPVEATTQNLYSFIEEE